MIMSKKLTRNMSDKMIAGVASGLADYFQLDVTWVRIAFVLAAFFGGGGIWIYIILWIAVPENANSLFNYNTDYKVYTEDINQKTKLKTNSNINGNLIGGLVLIALGSYFLLDEFDIIPEWFRVGKLWPLIFVIIGLSILFKGARQESKKEDFDTSDFKKTDEPADESKNDDNHQTF